MNWRGVVGHATAWIAVCLALTAAAERRANAADHLIGHAVSTTKYGGNPAAGKLYKFIAKAGRDGNPLTFTLPGSTAGFVTVGRGGGLLTDSLTGGAWTGLGNPPGSTGWKYTNKNAPVGGPVKSLLVTKTRIKLIAKSAGTMPPPAATNGVIDTLIALDTEQYCGRAQSPHFKEVENRLIKSTNQLPPPSCPTCFLGTDTDGDRLDDCYETNTMIFVSPTDAGTDPEDTDTDDDGIGDGDEVIGTLGGLNLPAIGTNPLRRDILIEYDWFDDNLECFAHSHRPTDAAVALVTAAFAAAPVANPDGSTGITVIHDRGQGGPFTGGNLIADADGVLTAGVDGVEFLTKKGVNFDANRSGYFHYTIMPHRYDTNSTSSGQAELPGDDMIVSLYCAISDVNVGHTIMHELGHNLWLGHGGSDHCNYKPNYNSVMNYLYQFPGVDNDCTPPGNGILDYSIGDRIPLDETNLDENQGVCGSPAWDWNSNSILETGVVLDLNPTDPLAMFLCGGVLSVLHDSDDWSNLWFFGTADTDGAPRTRTEIIDCDNPAPMPMDM